MLDSSAVQLLFDRVLNEHLCRPGVREQDIRTAVQNIAYVYAPEPASLQSDCLDVANYNDIAHRCAYLHKFGAFHTALVQDAMVKVLEEQCKLFKTVTTYGDFEICSLGGGPGSDVLGVISVLSAYFGAVKTYVTIVDIMGQWESTFASIINELAYGDYGTLRTNVTDNFLDWNYIGENLLDEMSNPVSKAISQASLITMVKFVSAAACQDTEEMLKRIFTCMKPGGMLLFIDNAAGGFHGLLTRTAKQFRFITAFGPLYHYTYLNESLQTEKFGYTSCFMTTVTIHLLMKPPRHPDMKLVSRKQNSNTSSGVVLDVRTHPYHAAASQNDNNLDICVNLSKINLVEGNDHKHTEKQPKSKKEPKIKKQRKNRNQYAYRNLSSQQEERSVNESRRQRALSGEDLEEDPCDSCCIIS